MPTANPYLDGNYAPVLTELTVEDLPTSGTLPAELCGRYLRNGPNPITPPEPATYHWFTGSGMVHGVRIADGRARWYRNRWVRSSEVAAALGEPAHPGPVVEGMDFAPNTNVIGHAGRTYAIVEAGARPYELTDELETVGPSDFGGTLPGGYTAHPKRDPATAELHAVSYYWGWGNRVQYTVTGTDGRVRRVVDVPVGGMVSVHDMSLTPSYAVIYDLPVVFSPEALADGASFPYRWSHDYESRVGLLPLDGSAEDVVWCEVEPCYVFHPMNAWDDAGAVVVDLVRYPSMFATNFLGPDEGSPVLERWRIDPKARKVATHVLDDRAQEFPRVDERVVGRPYRFGYAAMLEEPDEPGLAMGPRLVKHDMATGTSEVHTFPRAGTGEAVFVPTREDADEDDGYVLSLVYDGERDASDLVVLAAQDFTGEPVATVHLPARVPYGFHGNWVPDD
ncbi:MAG TPA: carotenoid oxygenase family protein [Acidimicrobiales bacterium]|nr:carotenoid oxygenase family protein [Acidimicrobiales bacterium]